jgi:polysaccharide export outer membrane protein
MCRAKKPFINYNRCKTEAVSLEGIAPVRVARAFRLPIITVMTALALSGCMRTTSPVATAQPRSDLDTMAYGQPTYYPAPVASTAPPPSSGGAIAALNASRRADERRRD